MPTKRVQTGITRFDIQPRGTKGYMVRVSRQGKMHNRFFSDKECGGKRKALSLAREHYDELVKKLPPPSTSKDVVSVRNTSGRVGVHLAINPSENWSDVQYSSYVASWKNDEGKRKKISFSVEKYGKRKALELATIAREKGLTDRAKVEKLYESRFGKKSKKKAAKKTSKKKPAKKVAQKKINKKKVAKKTSSKKKTNKKTKSKKR